MELPLYELVINDEDDESGVDFISLVDKPAIKRNWIAFKDEQFESYTDYPEQAKENAKIALRYAEENGWGDCGTDVGKQRANQLAKGEAISRDTIARMAAFERHRQNSDKELGDGCGRLMWLAWGGDAGVEWAQRKLSQIDKKAFSFKSDQEKRIISGPAMIPNELIYRKDKEGKEYNVVFSEETIQKIVEKYFKSQYTTNFNLQHKKSLLAQGVYLIESFVIDEERGINAPKGFEDLPNGSWFISCKVDNDEIWNDFIKEGVFKGFSVEGFFQEKQVKETKSEELELLEMLNRLQQDKYNIITNMSEAKNLLDKLKSMFQEETIEEKVTMQEAKLADGITIIKWDGELKEGTLVSVVSEEGEIPAPTGDHELQDGRKITIEEGGMVSSIEMPKEEKEDEKEAGEVEIKMSEQEIMAIKEMCKSYESRIKALEDKMKVDSEMISEQTETIGKQKEAMSLMFQIVEKLADEPSAEVSKTESFNVKLSEQKQNELDNLSRVVEFLNKK
jgi:hypothetical protein